MKDMGIEVRFVDPADPQNFANAVDDKTRAFYAETLPNPKLEVFPIKAVADIGRPLGIPLIMDNTAAPILCRPFDHGAAVIVYSATKYIGGHGTSVGGLIVDSGNFDWEGAGVERQPMLNSPDPSYHGAVWTEAVKQLGPIAYILKARTTLLRDLGGAMSPMNAFQFLQGMETLALRMRAHCENADAIAAWLSKQKGVTKVIHPSLLEGGVEAGKKFIDNLELLYHVANIGDARSLAIHPASTTHSQLSEEDQIASGVTPGYVRLSIGIEHVDDIIADIEQALKNI
jgi:O-acetylhomoserine (thiol)-lyase